MNVLYVVVVNVQFTWTKCCQPIGTAHGSLAKHNSDDIASQFQMTKHEVSRHVAKSGRGGGGIEDPDRRDRPQSQ